MELFNRMIKNRKNSGKLTREKYPPGLRSFALTVHFYSPTAYFYNKKTFDLALPHPDVLRTWYSSVDAEPGFTEESFETLKEKSNHLKEKDGSSEELGARMRIDQKKKENDNLYEIFKVHFPHPVPGEPDINVIFDVTC